jgi:hypothetical protein
LELWTTFKNDLCADFAMHHHEPRATSLALQDIALYLSSQGSSLTQHGLPNPTSDTRVTELDQELNAFLSQRVTLLQRSEESYEMMNEDQKTIYNRVLDGRTDGGCFFIDGQAGRGKTFLVRALSDRFRGEGQVACITGTIALSVIHYERGRTAHSTFGVPVQVNDEGLTSKISITSSRADLLREASLLIWEELPMAKKPVVECVDQVLQDIMGSDLPFGGKLFLSLGDFRQVAPVITGASGPTITLNSSIRSSYLWQHFQILRLTIPIRNAGDPGYAEWVDRVGEGLSPFETTVPLLHLSHLDSMEQAAELLFTNDNLTASPDAVTRAFLSPFNARVNEFNRLILDKLPGSAGILAYFFHYLLIIFTA